MIISDNRLYSLPLTQHDTGLMEDTQDWFTGRRAGHMSKWLYSSPEFEGDKVNGANMWANVVRGSKLGSSYYVYRDEYKAIADSIKKISSLIDAPCTIVDLGPVKECPGGTYLFRADKHG